MHNNDIVYVCFVQNNFGVLNGEETISCMMVAKSQARIDKWLDEQVNEAIENGYTPDEAVEDFKGKNDYYLTVSKGNETDGFDSYCFVCKPKLIEEE